MDKQPNEFNVFSGAPKISKHLISRQFLNQGKCILEELEGNAKEGGSHHEPDPENNVFGEMDGRMGDISPREWFHIGRSLTHCDLIGPQNAHHRDHEPQQWECTAIETEVHIGIHCSGFELLRVLRSFCLVHLYGLLRDELSIHLIL